MHARRLAVLACLFALTGCGLPLPLVIASYVADGISFVATGKSVTDHGISEIASEDCAMFRIIRGDPICRPGEQEPETQLAAVSEAATPEAGRDGRASTKPGRSAAARGGSAAGAAEKDKMLVIGSFADRRHADRLSRSVSGQPVRLLPVRADGRILYRVALGPFAAGELERERVVLRHLGFADAWAIGAAAEPRLLADAGSSDGEG